MGTLREGQRRNEVSDPRADIPRERVFYPGTGDSVRNSNPWSPASGITGAAPTVPVMGILILAGVVLVFEHFRKGR